MARRASRAVAGQTNDGACYLTLGQLGSWATDTSDKYEREVGGGWRVGDDCADMLLNKDVADGTRARLATAIET